MITHTSINYKSFSLQERENYLLSLDSTLQRKSIVLATCNRVEIYQGEGIVDEATVRHLFELTSGLKSRLIGETSIQGQVKQAYFKALKNNSFDRNLHKLFQTAICVGKKVRFETGISQGAMSHSQATIQFIEKQDFDIRGLTFALFGVNNLNETILRYLQKKGVRSVFIGNRNLEKALEMAWNFSFGTFRFSQKKQIISQSDVVISATSAPHIIINSEDIIERQKPLKIFDLAVPRDVDPLIVKIRNVSVFNIEQIESQIDENIEKRKMYLDRAKQLVESEVTKFMKLQKKRFEYGRKDTENSVAA
jgi:glutamyl-tRNA reductase